MKRRSRTVFLVPLFVAAMSCVVLSGQASALKFNEVGSPTTQNLSCSTAIKTDPFHPLLTHMTMIEAGNDGFVGRTPCDGAISLFSGTTPLGGNGGTDENSTITKPHPGRFDVGGATGIPLSFSWTCENVAQIKAAPTQIPSPLFLLGTGLVGLAGFNNRRKSEPISKRFAATLQRDLRQ